MNKFFADKKTEWNKLPTFQKWFFALISLGVVDTAATVFVNLPFVFSYLVPLLTFLTILVSGVLMSGFLIRSAVVALFSQRDVLTAISTLFLGLFSGFGCWFLCAGVLSSILFPFTAITASTVVTISAIITFAAIVSSAWFLKKL